MVSQNLAITVAVELMHTDATFVLASASLKFMKACIKTNNSFYLRHISKYDLLLPMLDLLEAESYRDNMLTSACLEILNLIRKVSLSRKDPSSVGSNADERPLIKPGKHEKHH